VQGVVGVYAHIYRLPKGAGKVAEKMVGRSSKLALIMVMFTVKEGPECVGREVKDQLCGT
jgi:hypothetical protein